MKLPSLFTGEESMNFAVGAVVGAFLFLMVGLAVGGEWTRVAAGTVAAAVLFGFGFLLVCKMHWVPMLLASAVMGVVIIPLCTLLVAIAFGLYGWASRPDIGPGMKVTGLVAVTFVGGLVFYGFRHWSRFTYGLVEIAVALGLACVLADSARHGPELFFALLTGGIYLCVRGLDNIEQGVNKKNPSDAQPADPVWRLIKGSQKSTPEDETPLKPSE